MLLFPVCTLEVALRLRCAPQGERSEWRVLSGIWQPVDLKLLHVSITSETHTQVSLQLSVKTKGITQRWARRITHGATQWQQLRLGNLWSLSRQVWSYNVLALALAVLRNLAPWRKKAWELLGSSDDILLAPERCCVAVAIGLHSLGFICISFV